MIITAVLAVASSQLAVNTLQAWWGISLAAGITIIIFHYEKAFSKILVGMVLVTVLSACGGSSVATPTVDKVSVVYTDAAKTLLAQEPTSTPTATATQLPSAAPTSVVPSALAQVANPTAQNVTSLNSSTGSSSTANGCNDASYVSDVTIPDGTLLSPGKAFTKTWEFRNTGTCSWDGGYLITFVSGTDMDGSTTGIDQGVLSGSLADISVSLVAPDTAGTYTGYWRMADGGGNVFGQWVYVLIVVSDDAATVTPAPTQTVEVAATSAPTSTPEVTATNTPSPVPAETGTPIPTETSSG